MRNGKHTTIPLPLDGPGLCRVRRGPSAGPGLTQQRADGTASRGKAHVPARRVDSSGHVAHESQHQEKAEPRSSLPPADTRAPGNFGARTLSRQRAAYTGVPLRRHSETPR